MSEIPKLPEAEKNPESPILANIASLLKQVNFDTYSTSAEDKETQWKLLAELQAFDEAIIKISPEMREILLSPANVIENLSIQLDSNKRWGIQQYLTKRNILIKNMIEKTELEKTRITKVIEKFAKGKKHLSDEQKEDLSDKIEDINSISESIMTERIRSSVLLYVLKHSDNTSPSSTLQAAKEVLLLKIRSAMWPEYTDDGSDTPPLRKDGKPLVLFGYAKTLFDLRALRKKLESEPEETLFTKIFKI